MPDCRIHPTAVIDPLAQIGDGTEIGPYVIIKGQVEIGENSRIDPHTIIEGPTTIGRDNEIFSFSSIGTVPQDLKYAGEDSRLIIGSGNKIREYVTINRGTHGGGMATQIGDGNLLMANVHIAHDCHIGSHNVLGNAATLGGHVVIGNQVGLGAYSGVHQFCRLGDYCYVGGYTVITRDVPPYTLAAGNRARLHGLNRVGLKRFGFSPEIISRIKRVYRVVFRQNLPLRNALEQISAETNVCREVALMVDFIRQSQRGLTQSGHLRGRKSRLEQDD